MSPDEATRVIGYIRVSSEDQVREGVSLDVQEARIRDYFNALPKRTRGWDGLVVVKLDRLTRSVKDLGTLMDAFKRVRVGFTSIQESVDTSSPSGELFFNLVASVSQWERRAIGERTQAAMSHLRRQGRRISRFAPYGRRIVGG